MADIHILECAENGDRTVVCAAFHVDINLDNNEYPGTDGSSVVPDLGEAEENALIAGTLLEHVKSWKFPTSVEIAAARDVLRAAWHDVKAAAQIRIDTSYQWYGAELERSA